MITQQWASQIMAALGFALLLAVSSPNLAAQTDQPKQAKNQDLRYLIHVSGIT